MAERAAAHGRTIDFGFRAHVIVRETALRLSSQWGEIRRIIDAGTIGRPQ